MRKGLIIALAAVLVLGLSGVAMAWTVDEHAFVDDTGGFASGVLWGQGGAVECDDPTCAGCPWTLDYTFTSQAGIINVHGSGDADIYGTGVVGSGWMTTEVYSGAPWLDLPVAADRVFINDSVDAYVCQPCCVIDRYLATKSVNVEDGQAYILNQQVTGLDSPSGHLPAGVPTTEQFLRTYGTAGYDIDGDGEALRVAMEANRWESNCMDPGCPLVWQERHKMGIFGENVDFDVTAFQGMSSEESKMYGALGSPCECCVEYDCLEIYCPDDDEICACCPFCADLGVGFSPVMSYDP